MHFIICANIRLYLQAVLLKVFNYVLLCVTKMRIKENALYAIV